MIRPNLQLLSEEHKNRIHRFSVRILGEIGIRVESDVAVSIFRRSGAVSVENDKVFIHEELIDHALSTVPATVALYDKQGEEAFTLGKDQKNGTCFGIGATNICFKQIETGDIVPFSRELICLSTSLGDSLDNFQMISTPGIPADADVRFIDLYGTLDMYANTDKPLVLLIPDHDRFIQVLDLLHHLHGDISSKPFCIPYLNPITPLVLNRSTTDKLIAAIRAGLPVMFSNYGMYGATTPISEGGTLSLLNAELLAGLVLGQLIREGSGMILGSLPAAFNMVNMGSCYTTSTYLLNLACAEMMVFYGIPHCGTSGSTNGWGADLLASADLWQNHLTACLGKVGCAPFVGGSFDSLVFSPEIVVLSDFIVGEVKKLASGFELTPETVDLEEIKTVGHGGNFLTSPRTLEALSGVKPTPGIWPSLNLDKWKSLGSPRAESYLHDHTRELLSKARKASNGNREIILKGESYIDRSFR